MEVLGGLTTFKKPQEVHVKQNGSQHPPLTIPININILREAQEYLIGSTQTLTPSSSGKGKTLLEAPVRKEVEATPADPSHETGEQIREGSPKSATG